MPLVILEGADGSGKSTLAARLLKGTGHPTLLVKRSGPPGDLETIEFMSKWLKDQAELGLNVIADRHPIISECIYRPIVRREGAAPWTMAEAAGAMRDKDLLLIYCRTVSVRQMRSAHVEQQMDGVHDHYEALLREYDKWFNAFDEWGLPVYRHDYSKDTTCEGAINRVKKFWETHE